MKRIVVVDDQPILGTIYRTFAEISSSLIIDRQRKAA
jgi:hypothetical protein